MANAPTPAPPTPASPPDAGPPRRTVTARLMVAIDQATQAARRRDGTLRRRALYPLYAARLFLQVVRQWVRDRCPQQASSLAFQTTLSLVPLMAIALALLRATGALDAESSLVEFLSQQVLPVSPNEIRDRLREWSGRLSFQTAGTAGVVATLVLSFFLYSSVERIFNDIWRVERRRPLGQKFVVFYAMVTIVPALVGLSLYHAARYGLTTGYSGAAGALAATWAALFFANKFLPATQVSWRAAAAGSLLSALAFELAKHAFRLYVAKVAFEKYAGIYGALGLVPLFLLWIYYVWLVVLLGVEVSHAVQNLPLLERIERRHHRPEDEISGVVAARVLRAIIDAWRRGETPLSREQISARFDLAEESVERITRRLVQANLIVEVDGDVPGYVPARPPSDISLADVLGAFRGADLLLAHMPAPDDTPLEKALAEIEEDLRARARALTFDRI